MEMCSVANGSAACFDITIATQLDTCEQTYSDQILGCVRQLLIADLTDGRICRSPNTHDAITSWI